MRIEVVLATGAAIGESPTWAPAEHALYRFDPATRSQRSWPMPGDIGAFGLV